MTPSTLDRAALGTRLSIAYGAPRAEQLCTEILALVARHAGHITPPARTWVDQRDVMLISYGDSIRDGQRAPLAVLRGFLRDHLGELLSAVHLLPFYPYSSDDGFSVIDYRAVDPALGEWSDVTALAGDVELMFDAVINHISRQSDWFRRYREGDPDYAGFFIEADPALDYRSVTRPRALPLLTPVDTSQGLRHLWTTFSDDQIDLNYANPRVLLAVLAVLLFYVARGARFLRLDAIGFLWKESGTTCMHLPQTHALIQVMRQVLEAVAPGVILITETNVPHRDNIGYLGQGDEAHMVYQFPLPPLTLHALHSGSARYLTDWAASLAPTPPGTTFFNFLASHDGIGVRPVEGLLSEAEVTALAGRVQENGGLISHRDRGDGTRSPYELNINYLDAVTHPDDDDARRTARFMAAQAILLSMQGMPGIYIHSLLGSRNDLTGVQHSGHNRAINREKLDLAALEAALADPGSLRARVFGAFYRLLGLRRKQPAFHPNAPQQVLFLDHRVFALRRGEGEKSLLALINVSDESVGLSLDATQTGVATAGLRDLLGGDTLAVQSGTIQLMLEPYQVRWLVGTGD